MSEPRRPSLFDLPLERSEEEPDESASEIPRTSRPRTPERRTPGPAGARRRPDDELPLFPDETVPAREVAAPGSRTTSRVPPVLPETPSREEPDSRSAPSTPEDRPAPQPASLGARWKSGGLDLAFHAMLALVLAAGSWFLGARLDGIESLGLLAFLAVFSFLYTVIPLAFWGRTLGMMPAGLVASGGDEGEVPLTFGQTALRWLGGVLTVTLLGLPTLLALLGGRSFTDRLSGSWTWRLPRSPLR
jgi:hypothetical protein